MEHLWDVLDKQVQSMEAPTVTDRIYCWHLGARYHSTPLGSSGFHASMGQCCFKGPTQYKAGGHNVMPDQCVQYNDSDTFGTFAPFMCTPVYVPEKKMRNELVIRAARTYKI